MQDPPSSARDADRPAVPPFAPHTLIQHYELLAEIGRGGMGIVYRARDRTLARMVALKRPWPKRIADPAQRRRFLREARAAARISHPHVVPVFEVLEDDGVPWIAMELVDGGSLRGLIRAAGALPLEDVLRHAEGLADALAAAHAQNILHRDVNPNNILVDGNGRVLLTDFGLAHFVAGPVDEDAATASGSVDFTGDTRVVGTPGYTSPEQARGLPLDGRSDLFSLGAVLYEMCTGTRAFRGDTREELVHAVLHNAPADIPPSAAIPDALVRIVRKALAKSPDERYQTARDLLADVRALRRQVEYQRHAELHPTPARWRARRFLSRAAVLATLLLVVVAVAMHLVSRRPNPSTRFADRVPVLIADFDNTTGDAIFDETLAEGLRVALNQSRHVDVFPRERVVEVLRRMKRAPESRIDSGIGREICQRESLKILLDGSIRRSGNAFQLRAQAVEPVSGDLVFAESEQFAARDQLFGRVDALARRVRENLGESASLVAQAGQPLDKATTESLEALQLFSKARRLKALGDRSGAVKLLNAALQIDPGFAMAHLYLGDLLGNDGDIAGARTHLERAYALRDELTGRERQYIEADYYEVQGRYDEALASLETLVRLYPTDLRAHRRLAAAYDNADDLQAAIRELREALKLDGLDGEAHSHLALALVTVNSPTDALSVLEEARRRGLNLPDFHRAAGLARLSLGEVDRAREEFQRLEAAGGGYVDLGQLYLARTAIYEGKLSEAEERLSDGIRRNEKEHNQVYRALRLNLRARVRWLTGNVPGARQDLQPISDLDDETFGAYQLAWVGRLWVEMGDLPAARRVLAVLRRLAGGNPNSYERASLPIVEGEIALGERNPARAIERFLAAAAEHPLYEAQRGLALAYGAQRDWKRAADAWRNVLAVRGTVLRTGNPADLPIAHLELARVYRQLGDPARAAEEYASVLRMWREADETALRRTAEKESQELGVGPMR